MKIKNTNLKKEFKTDIKVMNALRKPNKKLLSFSSAVIFSVLLVLIPGDVYANEVDVKTLGLEETTIITVINNSEEDIKTLRFWLGNNVEFKSFKSENGWTGEKTPQGVIIFTSSDIIKKGESIKVGIKTNEPNPIINWKILNLQNETIEKGVIGVSNSYVLNNNPDIQIEEKYENSGTSIFSESKFRIIPENPNIGSTLRVVGENFGSLQKFDFEIDSKKIGEFTTDKDGKFITTMKIPTETESTRIELKIVGYDEENKIKSIKLKEIENRIPVAEFIKMKIEGVPNVVYRGDQLDISGFANPNSAITMKIINSNNEIINTRTAEVDSTGKWKLDNKIPMTYDLEFGKYSIVVSDGRNQIMKNWNLESDKTILIYPVKQMFEPGELIKFNGTAIPNKQIEIILENSIGEEVGADIKQVDESGFIEFEYQTIENDDVEGTWLLILSQEGKREFAYIGYGERPTIPINFEFDQANYKSSDIAKIDFIGKPSEIIKMIIITPSGKIQGEEISITLREDGRATHELELIGFGSGIYSAVIQKGNSQTSENFSVGLQIGSGDIEANTIKQSYLQGEKILLLGNTKPNVLMTATLVDPSGNKIKTIEIPSNNEGVFTEEGFRIPSDGADGEWSINVSSGSNLTIVKFDVKNLIQSGVEISLEDSVDIPGYGENIKIKLTATKKTSIIIQIIDPDNVKIDEINCITKSDFTCQTLYTITKDMIRGEYTIKAADSSDKNNTSEVRYLAK